MSVSVLYDRLLRGYYIYDSEEKESLEGSDGKMIWNHIKDLPEEFFGSNHSYTIDEVDFTLVKG